MFTGNLYLIQFIYLRDALLYNICKIMIMREISFLCRLTIFYVSIIQRKIVISEVYLILLVYTLRLFSLPLCRSNHFRCSVYLRLLQWCCKHRRLQGWSRSVSCRYICPPTLHWQSICRYTH